MSSSAPEPNREPGRGLRRWLKPLGVVGFLGALFKVLDLVGTWGPWIAPDFWRDFLKSGTTAAPVTSTTPVQPITTAPSSRATMAASALPSDTASRVSECVTGNGGPAACSSAEAWLVVDVVGGCTADAAEQFFGFDPQVNVLDLRAITLPGRCLVRPSEYAWTAGARAIDLQRAKDRYSLLATCLAPSGSGGNMSEVSCSRPHTGEYVTADRPVPSGGVVKETCDVPVTEYLDGTLADHDRILQPGSTPSGTAYRCLVISSQTLKGSVWQLGGRPLPLA